MPVCGVIPVSAIAPFSAVAPVSGVVAASAIVPVSVAVPVSAIVPVSSIVPGDAIVPVFLTGTSRGAITAVSCQNNNTLGLISKLGFIAMTGRESKRRKMRPRK